MYINLSLSFLLLFSCNLLAMNIESESSSSSDSQSINAEEQAEETLTVDEASKFLYALGEKTPWDINFVCCYSGITLLIATGVLGLFLGTILSMIYCDSCSYGQCTPDFDNPGCIVGLTCASSVGIFLLETLFSPLIVKAQHHYARVKNAQLNHRIRQQFTKGRLSNETLTEKDIRSIGPQLLSKQSDLLTKLSSGHVLVLAEENIIELMKVENKFSEEIQTALKKLSHMLVMNADELAEMLNNERAKGVFIGEPALWTALVRMLPNEIRNDQGVQEGLKNTLIALLDSFNNKKERNLDDIIANVLQGLSIKECLLKEVVVVDETKDDEQVTIKTEKEEFVVNKRVLMAVSDFFKERLSEKWPASQVLDLSKVDYDWVRLVVDVASGKKLDFYQGNFWSIIAAARYFGMPTVLGQCDSFIVEQDLLKRLVETWLKENAEITDLDKDSFATSWKFCQSHSFHLNQRILLTELETKLNNLCIKNASVLQNICLLTDTEMDAIINAFNVDEFNKKLEDQKFLRWAWEAVKEIRFLKDAVVNFCDENEVLTQKTWALIPDDLASALDTKKGI